MTTVRGPKHSGCIQVGILVEFGEASSDVLDRSHSIHSGNPLENQPPNLQVGEQEKDDHFQNIVPMHAIAVHVLFALASQDLKLLGVTG